MQLESDPNPVDLAAFLRRTARLTPEQIDALTPDEITDMARLLARSNYLAAADRTLLLAPGQDSGPRFTRCSHVRAAIHFMLLLALLLITCGLFGRIIL